MNIDEAIAHAKEVAESQADLWGLEYETLIENDKRKIEYCKNNNIELRIIKYNQSYDLKDLI